MFIRAIGLWCVFLVAGSCAAADLMIYDDALRNGFANLSWPGPQPHPDQNFQANFHQHQGSQAIFYKAHSWNGLSVGRPGNGWTTSQYPELRFWIRGDAGGEQLNLHLQGPGGLIRSQTLAPFVAGGAIAAGSYREVVIRFTQAPWSYNGTIERIDIQDASGNGAGNAQWVFIDDLRLIDGTSGGGGSSSGDAVFANGVETGVPSLGLSPTGRRLFHRLGASQTQRILVGHQASTIAGVGWRHWQFPNNRSDFHDVSGRYPAVYGWELESRQGDANETLDWITYALTLEEAGHVRTRGGINTFAMHMRRLDSPSDGSAWVVAPAGLCARLVPGGDLNAAYRAKLDGYAGQLLQLRSGAQAVPFLFRPFHEADGNWFWWGTTGCTDAQFKAMFRYTIDYLRNAGLRHMLVVYAPGIFTSQAQYLARYPGDDVVDVIAMDQYLRGTADPNHGVPVATLTQQLGIVHALAQARGKVAAWAETGQLNITSNDAFSQFRQAVQDSGAQLAYLMFWANYAANEYYAPHNAAPAAVKANFNSFLAAPMVTEGQYPAMYP